MVKLPPPRYLPMRERMRAAAPARQVQRATIIFPPCRLMLGELFRKLARDAPAGSEQRARLKELESCPTSIFREIPKYGEGTAPRYTAADAAGNRPTKIELMGDAHGE